MKAWKVTTESCEVSVIVLADNRSEAMKLARTTDWMADEEWCDLRARRLADLDHITVIYGGPCVVPWDETVQRLCRSLGWFDSEVGMDNCTLCGLYAMPDVPESHLVDDGECDICIECQAEKKGK